MNYDNYIELYEAVYIFNEINSNVESKLLQIEEKHELSHLGINKSIYKAILRILVANDLIECSENKYVMTSDQKNKYLYILNEVIHKDPNKQYKELRDKASNEFQFFFKNISKLEYEIYSRMNFSITYRIGKKVSKYLNLKKRKVLELGGNSGGFGTALLKSNEKCKYTVVDTHIPCKIGNELKKTNEVDIIFLPNDIFQLNLTNENYDYIILMNILHDFDDKKCLEILNICEKSLDIDSRIIVIEDILIDEFRPREVVMHGLRLAVECRGGRQRTINELSRLFSSIDFMIEKEVKIDTLHTMLVMRPVKV